MDELPLGTIPSLTLQEGTSRGAIDAKEIIEDWISKLRGTFAAKSFSSINDLFIKDCWWRDIVGISWDFSSKHGQGAVAEYLSNAPNHIININSVKAGSLQPMLLDIGGMIWVQSGFTFETPRGNGKGIVKMANVSPSVWKAWTVFTQLEQLNFQKDLEHLRIQNSAVTAAQNGSNGVVNGSDALQVLIVGAGQSGLSLGARLASMGIRTLLIDRHCRLGGSWRDRYKSVKLHTPTYTDHLPFLKIPENWPQFLGRDDVANFLEHYGQMMKIDVELGTELKRAKYNKAQREYTVEVVAPEGSRMFTARHVVLAAGVFSDQAVVPSFKGQESFLGDIYHSSKHTSAGSTSDLHKKRVVIVGAGTSAHDVAQDFVFHGAKEVSIIQRHPIFSLSIDAFEKIILSLWKMEGVSTEEADLIGNSTPIAVIRAMSVGMTKMISEIDKEMIAGLLGAGLALKLGDDGYGLADHQLIKGGHYYIDQGANKMIIDGRIKVYRCEDGVEEIRESSVTLADGRHVSADIIVLATGYHRNIVSVEQVMGKAVSQKLENFGNLDQEQERAGWWRNTGVPGFWYMTGSFMWSRQFSLPLALQIAAVEKGYNDTYYSN